MPLTESYLLTEDGDYWLTEDGFYVIIDEYDYHVTTVSGTGDVHGNFYYTDSDVSLDNVVNLTKDVTVDSDGITIIGGALTVTNAGGTVIIDGSSDMFRIAASGTGSLAAFTAPGNPGATTNFDVATGFTYVPAYLLYREGAAGAHLIGEFWIIDNAGTVLDWFSGSSLVTGGNQTRIQAQGASSRASGTIGPYSLSYYILEQTTI